MSADSNSNPPSPSQRRGSFNPSQKFSEIFGRSSTNTASAVPAYPGSIAQAAANANQRRRMSISTFGLSNSPTQGNGVRPRQGSDSNSSVSSGSPAVGDESAIEEGEGIAPTTPFARRMSFGAKALSNARAGSTGGGGSPNGGTGGGFNGTRGNSLRGVRQRAISSAIPEDEGRGEGFNWSDSLRSRAQRSSSITSNAPVPPMGHVKAASVAAIEPVVKEVKKPQVPDHFQERILKGDFYMD